MIENINFDIDELAEKIASNLESSIEDAVEIAVTDAIEDSVESVVSESVDSILSGAVSEAIKECFENFDFKLPDGTLVVSKRYMKLLSPSKTKQLLCYGGLRVDGKTLMVQTRISCWEEIATYSSKEEAKEAFLKVKNAIDSGFETFEL